MSRGMLVVILATVGLGLAGAPAQATNVVYQYTGTGGTWSSAGSWAGGRVPETPAAGDTAEVQVFNANGPSGSITTTMDIDGLRIDRLLYMAANTTINASGGRALGIRGAGNANSPNVSSSAAGNVLALPIVIADTNHVIVKSTGGLLTVSGSFEGPSSGQVSFFGNPDTGTLLTGRIRPAGAGPGLKTGVGSGILDLQNAGSEQAIQGIEVAVGLGLFGGAARLRLLNPSQIADAANVFVNTGVGGGSSNFDLNGRSEDVDGLVVNGNGTVTGGSSSGFLQVRGPLSMNGGTISGTADPLLELDGDATATSSDPANPASILGRVALKGARTFTVADGPAARDLQLSGVVSDAIGSTVGASLTKTGAGTLALTPPTSNLYTGGTTIADGPLFTQAESGRAIPLDGTIAVGDGTGGASTATLRFGINNDVDQSTAVAVRADGLVDLNGFSQRVASLSVQDGLVSIPGSPSAALTLPIGQVTMAGGTVQGEGALVTSRISATSSAQGPARISSVVRTPASSSDDLAVSVTPGAAPELMLTGAVAGGTGSTSGLTKAGGGTVALSGPLTLPGATRVQAGTLVMNGTQTTPVTVDAGATLGGNGTVGATTVAGTLAPASPSLRTGELTFGPVGRLVVVGPATAALPRVEVTGPTTIQTGARLEPVLTGNPPPGTALPVIVNDAADAIAGSFANAAEGFAFTGEAAQPFTVGYAAGDGNDLALTAGAVPSPPAAPTTPTTPSSAPPAADTRAPTLSVALAKRLKLAKQGTFGVALRCDEACTVTLAVAVTPPGRRVRTVKASRVLTLPAGKAATVAVAVPKPALAAVRRALKAKRPVSVSLSAGARDAAGNTGAAVKRSAKLRS